LIPRSFHHLTLQIPNGLWLLDIIKCFSDAGIEIYEVRSQYIFYYFNNEYILWNEGGEYRICANSFLNYIEIACCAIMVLMFVMTGNSGSYPETKTICIFLGLLCSPFLLKLFQDYKCKKVIKYLNELLKEYSEKMNFNANVKE
jgi:hypothetical protein